MYENFSTVINDNYSFYLESILQAHKVIYKYTRTGFLGLYFTKFGIYSLSSFSSSDLEVLLLHIVSVEYHRPRHVCAAVYSIVPLLMVIHTVSFCPCQKSTIYIDTHNLKYWHSFSLRGRFPKMTLLGWRERRSHSDFPGACHNAHLTAEDEIHLPPASSLSADKMRQHLLDYGYSSTFVQKVTFSVVTVCQWSSKINLKKASYGHHLQFSGMICDWQEEEEIVNLKSSLKWCICQSRKER